MMSNAVAGTICTKPWTDIFISARGEVRVCCWAGRVGNLDNSSLEEIWNSSSMQKLRSRHLRNNYTDCPRFCPVLNGKKGIDPYWNIASVSKPINNRMRLNRDQIERAIRKGLKNVDSKPIFVKLYSDNMCDLNCIHCHLDRSREDYIDSINILRNESTFLDCVEVFGVWGGEPFYSESSINLLRFIKENYTDVKIGLITNGKYLYKLTEGRIQCPMPLFVHISVDAATSEVYQTIRRGGDYSVLVENIVKLKRYRDVCGENFHVVLHMVIQELNMHEIGNFLYLGKEMKLPVKYDLLDSNLNWLKENGLSSLEREVERALKVAEGMENTISKDSLMIIRDYIMSMK